MTKLNRCIHMLLISVLLAAAGCTGSGSSGPEQPPVSEERSISLEAWIISNMPSAEEIFRESAAPYLAEHPSISLKVRVLGWASAWEEITAAALSGEGPDVLQLGTTWVPAVAAMGGLADLTGKVAEIGGEKAFFPASWQTTMIRGDSGIYAVPWFVDARAIYYRKDAFARAGVDPEDAFADWDSFREALHRVKAAGMDSAMTSVFGITGGNDWDVVHNVFPWIWGAGGDVMDRKSSRMMLDSDETLQGVMYYTGLAHEGLVEPSSLAKNSQQIDADFAEGKFGVIISGPWNLRELFLPREEGGLGSSIPRENIGVAALPQGPKSRATFVGGSNLAVFKQSEHPDEAWGLIAYLSGEEANLRYAQASGMLPARVQLMASPELTSADGYAAFAEALQYGRSYPSIPQWGLIETTLVSGFREIWGMITDAPEQYSEQTVRTKLSAVSREIAILLQQ